MPYKVLYPKPVLVWLAILFILSIGAGQNDRDSLLTIWQDENQSDSVRGNTYLDYIYEYYYVSEADSALQMLDELRQFAEDRSINKLLVDIHSSIGYLQFRLGRYDDALSNYNHGLELAEEIDYELGAADILLRIGFVYHDNENIILAISYYRRSQKIYEKFDDKAGLSSVYNEFGSIYRAMGDLETSLDYYQKSIEINRQNGNEPQNAAMYSNLGDLYIEHGDFASALEYFEKGLEIYREENDYLGIARSFAGIGQVLAEEGKLQESLNEMQRSLDISEEINDIQGSASTFLDIGFLFLDQGRLRPAIQHCRLSLERSRQVGDLGSQMEACACLYEAYKGINNIEQALEFHELMNILEDSMQLEETAKHVQQIEFSNQMLADSLARVENEMQIRLAHQAEIQRKNMNRNLALAAGLFFLLLSVGLYRRWIYVKRSKAIIEKEKERSESLLLNILPSEIAEELKEKGKAQARDYDLVSILFTDFKGFTEKAARLSAAELIDEINHCFRAFDFICEEYGIEKIKTIGDAYMAAGGLPVSSGNSVRNTILAGLKMQAFIQKRKEEKAENEIYFDMRVGIHTGPVVAGIVGVKKFQYDVWGDTVNTAARMESNGEPGKVNVSQDTYELIKDDPLFEFTSRGKVEVKGKGSMKMWFVTSRSSSSSKWNS